MSILEELRKLAYLTEKDEDEVETGEDLPEEMPEDEEEETEDVEDVEDMDDIEDDVDIKEIIKHIENIQRAAAYIDKLTVKQPMTTAFEAEVALRKSLQKMQALSDEIYKKSK